MRVSTNAWAALGRHRVPVDLDIPRRAASGGDRLKALVENWLVPRLIQEFMRDGHASAAPDGLEVTDDVYKGNKAA
jgi:hypothetical protein